MADLCTSVLRYLDEPLQAAARRRMTQLGGRVHKRPLRSSGSRSTGVGAIQTGSGATNFHVEGELSHPTAIL